MKQNLIIGIAALLLGVTIYQAITISSLKKNGLQVLQQEGYKPIDLDVVIKKAGAGNFFINRLTADTMRHNFDIWHRNLLMYYTNGNPVHPNNHEPLDYINHRIGNVKSGMGKDSLSKAVWFDRDVVTYLSSVLQDPTNKLDGVRIYFAAYDKLSEKRPSQKYAHQATLLLVPTRDSSGHHIDDYSVIKAKALNDDGALNHGTLCPLECNDN